MLKRKSLLTTIAILIMVSLLFTGCGQSTSTTNESPAPQETKELSIAARAGAMADALAEVAKEYESTTGIAVKINALPYDSLKETIVLDVRNNSGAYDLAMLDDPWMPEFGESGLLASIEEYFKDGVDPDFVDTTIDLCRVPYATGALHALPLIGNVQMFFYRSDLLEKYNLEAPKTWDDVIKNAEIITKEEKDTYGYVIRGQRGNPIVSDYLPVFWAYGGVVLDSNMKPQVNSEAGKKAMETYLKLKELGPKGVETFDSDQIATALTQGNSAMTIAWPSWVSRVDNPENSKVVGMIDFSPVPAQVTESSAMIGNWLLAVPKSSKNKEEAVEFLKWVTNQDIQKKMAMFGGGVPTRVSVYQDEELIAKYRHYPAQLEALKRSVARPRTPYWSRIEDAWGLYLSQIVAGQIGIEEGLNKANDEIAKILQ